ncbi:MAG: nucleoside 2-deoxyribosyltransferase [Desulfobacula sp.]|nr:nucleoside 2-deoxyribosyltransferase [Desulfobacula sp.]
MTITCLFCNNDVSNDFKKFGTNDPPNGNTYICARCGIVRLTYMAAQDFPGHNFSQKDKNAISITLRNEWERNGKNSNAIKSQRSFEDLEKIVRQYKPLDPLEKMDRALLNLGKQSDYIGCEIPIDLHADYPYYSCNNYREFESLIKALNEEGFISIPDDTGMRLISITTPGYKRLREIQRPNQDSKKAFVAMWFDDSMNDIYDEAIKKAIEYIEPGESEPRFKALKIEDKEHINDINDEIIAQIRRSRFMVCDLTGYRGGVYFEAGFAYGLGLPVIYTCRKDWTRDEDLKDAKGEDGKKVKILYDSNDNPIRIKKVGVHFDLAHRNRIQWNPDDLDDFRKKLKDRIRAVIY